MFISSNFKPLGRCFFGGIFFLASAVSAEALSIKQVADGVYVHQGIHAIPDRENRGEIANIGFIVGERCVAVIDTGGSLDQGRALRNAVRETTAIPICYVINTHVHPDHVYGNRVFKQDGTTFVGHYKLPEAMAKRAPFYMEKATRDLGFKMTAEDFIAPQRLVRSHDELDLGGRMLKLVAHGVAHTDSDLSVYDDKTQTLWLADLLFMGHIPVIDGSLNGWLAELTELRNTKAKLAIPGHGPVSSEWPSASEGELNYLNQLKGDVGKAIRDGKTLEYALDHIGVPPGSTWQLGDEFHKRNVSKTFAELEWDE